MFRYFGPPGTGKTTTLLNQVDSSLSSGILPEDIGYFAFTRKAAYEARDRAFSRFHSHSEKDFSHFRTLHSLAFKTIGLNGSQVFAGKSMKDFCKKVGVNLASDGASVTKDEGFSVMQSNNPVMRCFDLARNSLKGPRYAYNFMNLSMNRIEFEHLYKEYERYKRKEGLLDFTDMMLELSENPSKIPSLKVVFLDEAQDLTPLQWKVAHLLSAKSDRMFVAGDDDQGIYRWAGADIDHFISLPGASEVLTQSYRIPRLVFAEADKVVRRIQKRQKKEWFPRNESGSVERTFDATTVDFNGGEWLVMAQANYMLEGLEDYLRMDGHYYESRGRTSLSKKVKNAIQSWEFLQKSPDNAITQQDAINLYDHISSGKGMVRRGAKKVLSIADKEEVFSLEMLHKNFGLEATQEPWEKALDRIDEKEKIYASALLHRGVNIYEKPKIRLSTIHGAKGGEADNVLLYLDLSTKALAAMQENPDDAHRVLYVGMTRAKKNLVLKMPEDSQRGWAI